MSEITDPNFHHPYMVALRRAATMLLDARRRAKVLGPRGYSGQLIAAQNTYRMAYDAAEKAGVLCRDIA